jgi:alpha-ketoglutarate-dependent 2,4-dichlorophenoxyacetate dioxygenase
MYGLGNRLGTPTRRSRIRPGRYSMLHARVLPPVEADTEFADMRAAYDELDDATKAKLEGLQVHHSIAYSRETLGFEFSEEERARLKGAVHPLVRTNPRTARRSLYLASHASHVVGWPVPEGRLLLRDLTEHATPIALRLPAFLARGRSCDLGQPRDDAFARVLRRIRAPPRAATRVDPGLRR